MPACLPEGLHRPGRGLHLLRPPLPHAVRRGAAGGQARLQTKLEEVEGPEAADQCLELEEPELQAMLTLIEGVVLEVAACSASSPGPWSPPAGLWRSGKGWPGQHLAPRPQVLLAGRPGRGGWRTEGLLEERGAAGKAGLSSGGQLKAEEVAVRDLALLAQESWSCASPVQ
jgi:hypothetical protein